MDFRTTAPYALLMAAADQSPPLVHNRTLRKREKVIRGLKVTHNPRSPHDHLAWCVEKPNGGREWGNFFYAWAMIDLYGVCHE